MADDPVQPADDKPRSQQRFDTEPRLPDRVGPGGRQDSREPLPSDLVVDVQTGPHPFAVYLDLSANEWRTWDAAAGLGPVPRKVVAGTDGRRGWVLKKAFDKAVREAKASPDDLAIDGGGRFLHFTGRSAGADLTLGRDFTAVLAAYLGGAPGSRPGRAVVYHPGDGGWVRVGFSTAADPPRLPAPAGRKPGDHEPLPAEAVAALGALPTPGPGLTAAAAAARLQPVLDALAGKAAARAAQARHVTAAVNAFLDTAGLVLTAGGRAVRLSVTNLKTTAGSFRLRALGAKNPETVSTSRTFPAVTAVPA